MDTVEFIKQINRLCEAQEDCKDCPLIGHACDVNTATIMSCYNIESVQKMVQIVEQWAKDNPIKTRQSEFLKKFPDAYLSAITRLLPCSLDKTLKPLRCAKYGYLSITCRCDTAQWIVDIFSMANGAVSLRTELTQKSSHGQNCRSTNPRR